MAFRVSQVSPCPCSLSRKDEATGIAVNESRREQLSKHYGERHRDEQLALQPLQGQQGKNTMTMMAMPEVTGTATSRVLR